VLLSPRLHRTAQCVVGVVLPPGGEAPAGAAQCVQTAIQTVTAGLEERRAGGQEAAVRPAVFAVAEVGGSSPGLTRAQLYGGGLQTPAQVQLWEAGPDHDGWIQPHCPVEGKKLHLVEEMSSYKDINLDPVKNTSLN